MTVMIEDLSELEGMLDETPPCQGLVYGKPCLRPAVARVTVTCCGTMKVFVCTRCLTHLKLGAVGCNLCFEIISRWSPA